MRQLNLWRNVLGKCLIKIKNMEKEQGFGTITISVNYTKWGIIRYYTDDTEFRFAMYKYDDNEIIEYLSNVYVEKQYRRKGLGNGILKLAEEEAISRGAKYLILRALRGSWMRDWYERHGYKGYQIDGDFPEYISAILREI